MRHIFILVGLLCGLGLTGCGGSGRPLATEPALLEEAGDPMIARATGGTHFINNVGFLRRTSFVALAHASGASDGEYELVAGATIIHGRVTCLSVKGNQAWFGGVVTDAKFTNVVEGTDFAVRVIDNGEGQDPPDQISRTAFNLAPGSAEVFCATRADPFPLQLNDLEGNIQVSGATP